ncbi:helix-turn-helix domain-containing protein [Kribbella sp. NPDC051770]|uniref:helix-turn-helix domain-containing protein n=1 Tax=Kribbella sp. NPDC051770 TaxID=3155413 RepID=UPI0034151FF4
MAEIIISDWTKLGSALHAARHRQRLSQEEVAQRAGVSRSWLARVEAGHRGVEFEQLLRLVEALGLSLALTDSKTANRAVDAEGLEAARLIAATYPDADKRLRQLGEAEAEARRRSWGIQPAAEPDDE